MNGNLFQFDEYQHQDQTQQQQHQHQQQQMINMDPAAVVGKI